jgi:hypothetical protein
MLLYYFVQITAANCNILHSVRLQPLQLKCQQWIAEDGHHAFRSAVSERAKPFAFAAGDDNCVLHV